MGICPTDSSALSDGARRSCFESTDMTAFIITEKPSVASDIAKTLGGFKKIESIG